VGSYLAVTGRSITDLAMIIGVSPGTLYNRMKKPEDMRLKEYRRICEELETVRS
jgi:DNA-binding Xre family transcriptional regulator